MTRYDRYGAWIWFRDDAWPEGGLAAAFAGDGDGLFVAGNQPLVMRYAYGADAWTHVFGSNADGSSRQVSLSAGPRGIYVAGDSSLRLTGQKGNSTPVGVFVARLKV